MARAGRRLPLDPSRIRKITDPAVPQAHKYRILSEAIIRLSQIAASGLPMPHSSTHKGGQDSVVSRTLPSAITLGQHTSDIGNPAKGFSPGDHVHDDRSLAGIAGLLDVTTTAGGTLVVDASLRRILFDILVELKKLEKRLG